MTAKDQYATTTQIQLPRHKPLGPCFLCLNQNSRNMAVGKVLKYFVFYLCRLSKKSQVLTRLSKLFYTAMYRLLSRGQPLIWYHMYLYFIFQIIRFNKWFDVLLRYTLVRDRHSPPSAMISGEFAQYAPVGLGIKQHHWSMKINVIVSMVSSTGPMLRVYLW